MASRVAYSVLVRGRVQGVAFRWSTQGRARELGVHGWVRNLADGRVEAHLEGERRAVEALLAWMEEGPSAAQVEEVHVDPAPQQGMSGFEILDTAAR